MGRRSPVACLHMGKLIADLISKTPPEVICHYTDQRGPLGILESDELWLTHIQYLNDSREFSHALDLVRAAIVKRATVGVGSEGATLTEVSKAVEGDIQNFNVCVASLSEDGDDLSQWRAYGGLT